ncbi:hypothetical protein [Porcipelethomonas sp.]|uniref:hypothetical protein n=1 Tax=Porcipelethomonas sp. TaxID=2981675 RepID=UPI003EF7B4C5
MVKRVYCGKKTKIYIPKTVNPQIISYKPCYNDISNQENIAETELGVNSEETSKRR